MSPDPSPVAVRSPLHAILVLPTGDIDFDCPHVDARSGTQPLFYDEEPLSVWAFADEGRDRLELGGLHGVSGSRLDPWPVLEQEIYLSDMIKREDASLGILDLYLLTSHAAAERCSGDAAVPPKFRVCCTHDLLVLDIRMPDDRPVRPRLSDLRGGLEPLTRQPLLNDDLVLPIFSRGRSPVSPYGSDDVVRRRSLDAQARALLDVVVVPLEVVAEWRPHA